MESNSLMLTQSLVLSSKVVNIAWKYGLADAKIALCPFTIVPSSVSNLISHKTPSLETVYQ